ADHFLDLKAPPLTPDENRASIHFITFCGRCHHGAETSAATFHETRDGAVMDQAFLRTGVRPEVEDTGAGDGRFRTIGLRNVELTGPYFHNGGSATLEEVLAFYARGGDFPPGPGTIFPVPITTEITPSIMLFLRSLTDDRVRFERAPFDHPELCVP